MSTPFLKVGQVIKSEAIDFTPYGYGHLKINNFSIFVPNLLPQEVVDIKITKLYKNYGFGEIVKFHMTSNNRIEPFCPIFLKCGGCDIQHLNHKTQTNFKLYLANHYLKEAKIDYTIKNILMMENSLGYRNKVSVPFRFIDNKLEYGFYKKRSNEIVEFIPCGLQSDIANDIVFFVADLIEKYQVKTIRHLIIRESKFNENFMVTVVVRSNEKSDLTFLSNDLVEQFPKIISVVVNYNDRNDNVILGSEEKILFGEPYLIDELLGLKFRISSQAFYQINYKQTKKLYLKAISYANLKKDDTILDLYCGIGTIGLIASRNVEKVYGIEIVKEAILDAKYNAEINNIENVEFYVGKASQVKEFINDNINVVFVDPPRKGLGDYTCQEVINLDPKTIVYISCNIKSLVKDLNYFINKGYKIDEFSLVDMFPETIHTEVICKLEKN